MALMVQSDVTVVSAILTPTVGLLMVVAITSALSVRLQMKVCKLLVFVVCLACVVAIFGVLGSEIICLVL